MAKQMVSIKLPPDLVTRLDFMSEAQGISRSDLIRGFITNGLNQQEQLVKAMGNPVLAKAYSHMMSDPEIVKQMAVTLGEKLDTEQLQLFRDKMARLGEVMGGTKKKGKGKK